MSKSRPADMVGALEPTAQGRTKSARAPVVFGIRFSSLDRERLARLLIVPLTPGSGVRLIATANVDHIVHLQRNARFRDAYASAFTVTADGAPVALYARLRGARIPGRVSGPDLLASLMHAMRPGQHRLFFVVGNTATGERLRAWLQRRGFAAETMAYECPRFGFECDPDASRRLAGLVREHRPTHLIMGVGAPKSEIWINEWRDQLGDCYALALGAAVDFFVGAARRAPEWMRRVGLEWLWRLRCDPKRLWRRYLVDSWRFPVAVADDLRVAWRRRRDGSV